MGAFRGSLVALAIGDGASPVESFTTLGGVELADMQLSHAVVESGSLSSRWRRLLGGAGIASLRVGLAGRTTDSATQDRLRSLAFAGNTVNCRMDFGNGDRVSGAFLISRYARSGNVEEAEAFSLTLESAGEVSFTAG